MYSFPLPQLPRQTNPFFHKLRYLSHSQAEQLPKFPTFLGTSAIVLLCIFSLNLSHKYANQKNSIIKGRKKIELLEANLFYHQKNNKKADRLYMKFSGHPTTNVRGYLNPLFQRTIFLLLHLFCRYLNSQLRINKMVNGVGFHPCPSRLASRIHTFIYL